MRDDNKGCKVQMQMSENSGAVERLGFGYFGVFGAMLTVEIRKTRTWFGRGLDGLIAIVCNVHAMCGDYVGTYDAGQARSIPCARFVGMCGNILQCVWCYATHCLILRH